MYLATVKTKVANNERVTLFRIEIILLHELEIFQAVYQQLFAMHTCTESNEYTSHGDQPNAIENATDHTFCKKSKRVSDRAWRATDSPFNENRNDKLKRCKVDTVKMMQSACKMSLPNRACKGVPQSLGSPSCSSRVHAPRFICRAAAPEAQVQALPRIKITIESDQGEQTIDSESGDILRDALLVEKIGIYTTWGLISNCNGGGQCGTCIVEVLEDESNILSEKNETELKKLNKVGFGLKTCWLIADL